MVRRLVFQFPKFTQPLHSSQVGYEDLPFPKLQNQIFTYFSCTVNPLTETYKYEVPNKQILYLRKIFCPTQNRSGCLAGASSMCCISVHF